MTRSAKSAIGVAGAMMLALATSSAVRAADQPFAGEVIRSSNGTLSPAFKTQHFCAQDGECHDLVIDTRTFAVVRLDGRWSPGVKETGEGEEVIYEEIILPSKTPPASQ